jgi:hypothetical protein
MTNYESIAMFLTPLTALLIYLLELGPKVVPTAALHYSKFRLYNYYLQSEFTEQQRRICW